MSFITRLVSNDEQGADSVIFSGLLAMIVMFLLSIWEVVVAHREFSMLIFAGASTTIMGGIAAGKRLRDGATPQAPSVPNS